MTYPRLRPLGDTALSVEFGERIDAALNARARALSYDLAQNPITGVVDVVPTYRAVLVSYDPHVIRGATLETALNERLRAPLGAPENAPQSGALWHVPVVYGAETGCDLAPLARDKGLSEQALIALHCSVEYRVYMIGFAPGFAYLGGLPEQLHAPRLATPRQWVPAGAIGIGGQQASINSVAGPSGWRYIGQTPWRSFDPDRARPFLFAAGDRIRFIPVSAREGQDIAARAAMPDAPLPEPQP
ncbi:Kinase A inhibitor [Aquimixticola soesokkakensis]|uniref:Kinase A inhibitor n=1 Tax=Aquimixticola soesokkakensis TaxID=1519096 RepID=A0A1Y5RR45_9RHOB|nr:5-oxoprolinase subunit PxpB [Aquimixticola soesokkakensis]SLN23424.1 Kinase A inhibitor [Aquimixticola soesokkakensis]